MMNKQFNPKGSNFYCLIFVLLLTFNVKPQTVYDTLYLHPDTTTFLDQTVIIVDDIVNMAVKFSVDSGWNSYQIEKILLSEPTGIDPNGFGYLFISTGELPEENMLDTIKIYLKPSFPGIEEIPIDPPINISNSKNFFISGDIRVITISYPLQEAVPGEYAFWYSLQKWIEYVPYYFNLKVVVKKNLTGITEENNLPMTFKLEQNFPNPFNPSTTISYQLPSAGFVTLKIYDILGNEVRDLVNEYKIKGHYAVTFDASNLSNGVYFYKINMNEHSITRKMLLLK